MNAIEQMMQAFGAGSAQQVAAFFGSSAAAESNAAEFANQFTAALQNSKQVTDTSESSWRIVGAPTIDGFVAPDIEATEALVADLPVDAATALQRAGLVSALSELGLEGRSLEDLAAIQAAGTGANPAAGQVPGFQLVQITGAELTTMIESGQLQPMGSALPDLQTIQDDVFVFAAGGAPEQPLRLLPLAQLEPLLPTDATDQASQVAAKVAAADGKPAVGTPATDSPAVSSPEASKEAAAAELTGKVVADQTTATSKAAASETFHFAAEAHGAKANAEKQAAANHKAAEEKLALQQQAQKQTQQSAQGAAQAAAPSTEAANKQAANAAPQAAAAAQQATPKQDRADSEQKSSEARPAPSAPAAAQAAAAPKAAAQPAPITWTPEIAAGYTDGGIAASETMAGGLTSLRGESSFMNAMSLMGGKTSPELAAHVAKQVNMQVTRAVNGGTNEFTMRLNPSELGGLKIKMAFTEAGKVSAQVMVERPETLELLQREVKGIERAIESGGHKMDSQGISFSLDTGDGESAGKAFAKAVQEDQHADKHDVNAEGDGSGFEEFDEPDDLTDLATLEEILSRVTPESGLDVRV